MLIVQISDIHCGPMFNREALRTAIKEVNALSPDAVVVTGDITENGIQSEFKQATKELKQL
ncbi:metallophosphoesterase, partial [Candidatus Bathyarchaeota archaeon]|nr:metallophosphoesterase [Candidatus Bathyarchaeota archaeon]